MPTEQDRILAALKGLATGDAIGKQTETLSREQIAQWYPDGVRGFEGVPGTPIPRYIGNRKHEWSIGETTDDTERTIAVARAILRDGGIRHESIGRELLACRKCVHPGIRSLWEFHQSGDPSRVTSDHDGCGAAVRVGPVGMLYRSHRIDDIIIGAREASISTHGGRLALAAAAATAVAISAAIDGAEPRDIVALAERAADRAESTRSGSDHTTLGRALRTLHDDLRGWSSLDAATVSAKYFPASPLTIVPLALALATVMHSAESAILLATNIGGDSDSVASIAGTILGARYPETVNDEWYRVVEQVNDHQLMAIGKELSARRG